MPVERAFLDTNVFLAATDPARTGHRRARDILDQWPAVGITLYLSAQIVREYLVVATRPPAVGGLGLPLDAALENVTAVLDRTKILEETAAVSARLRDLLLAIDCSGKQIHDANVVATMMTHGVAALVTENLGDFRRFDDMITVLDLNAHTE